MRENMLLPNWSDRRNAGTVRRCSCRLLLRSPPYANYTHISTQILLNSYILVHMSEFHLSVLFAIAINFNKIAICCAC